MKEPCKRVTTDFHGLTQIIFKVYSQEMKEHEGEMWILKDKDWAENKRGK